MIHVTPVWVAFATGLFLGVFLGVAVMCVVSINRDERD